MRKQLHNSLILTVRNVMRFLTPVLLFWLISIVGDTAVAVPICPGNQCGTLHIQDYYAWQSSSTGTFTPQDPSDPRLGTIPNDTRGRGGARMQAFFNSNQSQAGNYAWIQAIIGGNSTLGTPPYIDPYIKDDNLPFYWTESELPDFTNGYNIELLDLPNQSLINSAFNPRDVRFETALVYWEDMTIYLFGSFTWGYTIDRNNAGGGYTVTAEPLVWTPSTEYIDQDLIDLVTSFDGNNDGRADGWIISEQCCAIFGSTIPEPSSSMLILLGLISIWLMKNRGSLGILRDNQL